MSFYIEWLFVNIILFSVIECKYFSPTLTPKSCFFSCSFTVLRDTTDRSSVPEPNSTETEKAPHVVQPRADLWAGETLPPARSTWRPRSARPSPRPWRWQTLRSNLVSKQKNKMEVSENMFDLKWIIFKHNFSSKYRNNSHIGVVYSCVLDTAFNNPAVA